MTTATMTKNDVNAATGGALAEWTDEELLLEYRQTGDETFFAELVRRYEKPLYSYLCRYLRDRQLAEDVFQASFLKLHLKCDDFTEGRKLRPWLYRIATNQAIDTIRTGRRHRLRSLDAPVCDAGHPAVIDTFDSGETSPSQHLEKQERSAWVRRAVAFLPEHLKCVVQLIYFQGVSYQDAAGALGIPIGTVKSRMHAALVKLGDLPMPDALPHPGM